MYKIRLKEYDSARSEKTKSYQTRDFSFLILSLFTFLNIYKFNSKIIIEKIKCSYQAYYQNIKIIECVTYL